ncbi:MAG TPA: nitroreductase/quinone reductase family protein [Microlunatus sp.]|nr:nitroreductase/quinone reductase family protein [Microlunatus sp.]
MPSDTLLKAMNSVHRTVLRLTGGRVGGRLAQMPVLELTTVGRRSGRARTVILTSPLQLDDAYVVVASRGGDNRHPAWYLNLVEQPDVEVVLPGGRPTPMRARVSVPPERNELWARIIAEHRNYAEYQSRTARPIPVVVLEPMPTHGD